MKPSKNVKTCIVCGITKPESGFPLYSRETRVRRNQCKPCFRKKRIDSWGRYENTTRFLKKDERADQLRKNHQVKRKTVLSWYGNRCECCGENTSEFLAIDHSFGGGTADRRMTGGTSGTLNRLYKAGKAIPGFRILCHNCNASYGYYGYCPHEEKRKLEAVVSDRC